MESDDGSCWGSSSLGRSLESQKWPYWGGGLAWDGSLGSRVAPGLDLVLEACPHTLVEVPHRMVAEVPQRMVVAASCLQETEEGRKGEGSSSCQVREGLGG